VDAEQRLLLQLSEVAVFAMLRFGGGFHELQKLPQWFSLDGVQVETHAHAKGRIALDDNAVEDEALHPDFSARHPEADLHIGSTLYGGDCFHIAAAHAGIGQISPDGSIGAIDF